MATKGQALEKLVESLEKMDMKGAIIKTRDKIYDKVAKEDREVDVSVRFRSGSHEFLIVFECRDRGRRNGPDWIEQIAQKTKDICANKVIAVSASGFTRSAIEKAKHHNIILRTIEEIASQGIFDWFLPKSFSVVQRNFEIKKMLLCGRDSDSSEMIDVFIKKQNDNFKSTLPFILQKDMEQPLSPNELLRRFDNDLLFSGVTCGGPKVLKKIIVEPEEKSSGFQLVFGNDRLIIDHFVFYVELFISETENRIQSVAEYKTEGESIAQILKFGEVNFPEGKKTLEIVLKPEGIGTCLSFRFKDPE